MVRSGRKPSFVPRASCLVGGDDHSSTAACYHAPLAVYPETLDGPPCQRLRAIVSLCGLASNGVYLAAAVTTGAVGSYPTISTLPGGQRCRCGQAVYFLWHFPRGCPHRALAGILPYEARTFLPRRHPCAHHRQRSSTLVEPRQPNHCQQNPQRRRLLWVWFRHDSLATGGVVRRGRCFF